MSIKNKISVISILVGVMFLGVSANAMENSEKKEESKSSLDESRNIINSEKGKEVNDKKIGEAEQETKELSESIDNQEKDEDIEDEEGTEENLKDLGYGKTKEEQQKTKEWVESWGFNNKFIYKEMEFKKFLSIYECLKTLIKEREKNINDLVKEFEKYEFLYTIHKEQIDYYDNFYGEYDNYEKIEIYKKGSKEILSLIESKNINKNVITKYIEEVLSWDKKAREKIKNYGQLINNALEYLKKNKIEEQFHLFEKEYKKKNKEEKENKYINSLDDLNVLDVLEKEYLNTYFYVNNGSKFLRDNEIVRFTKVWIDMWGGNLGDLLREVKIINLEEVKKYIEKIVSGAMNSFYEVLEKFEKYECIFNDCDPESISSNNRNDFFNFNRLEEIIEKENIEIKKEYGIQINAKIVSDYVFDELLIDEIERKKVSNYKDLIEKAYENFIFCSNVNRKFMSDSNLNSYKFYDEGYNFYVDSKDKEKLTYKSWKKGEFDIYREDALLKIDKEYEEIKFVLEMREILEKIMEQNVEELKTECLDILEVNQENIKPIGDMETLKFEDEEEEQKCLQRLKYLIEKKMNITEFVNYENTVDYSKEFFEILKQALDEDILKEFINEVLDLAKEEYYPGRFIEKFKKFIVDKLYIKNILEQSIKDLSCKIQCLKDYIKINGIKESFESLFYINKYYAIPWNREDKNYYLIEKLNKGFEKDFEILRQYPSNFEFLNLVYIELFFNLSEKYKLNFFEKFKKLVEGNYLKNVEEIEDIILLLGKIKDKKSNREDVEKLIDIIKDRIDTESLSKLIEIFGLKSDEKEGFDVIFLKKISNLLNVYVSKILDGFEQNVFFKKFENLIKNYYKYGFKLKGIVEQTQEYENAKPLYPDKTFITEVGAERILKKFEEVFEIKDVLNENKGELEKKSNNNIDRYKDILEKFKYILLKKSFKYTKILLVNIKDLVECCISKEEFKDLFISLVEKIYKIKYDDVELYNFLVSYRGNNLYKILN